MLLWCFLLGISVNNYRVYSLEAHFAFSPEMHLFLWLLEGSSLQSARLSRRKELPPLLSSLRPDQKEDYLQLLATLLEFFLESS